MNWAVRKVMDVCQIRWDKMHPVVEEAQLKTEQAGEELMSRLRAGGETDGSTLNEAIEAHAQKTLQVWHELAMSLIFNFSDNSDMKTLMPLSYPNEWLNESGYKDGPPDVPVE